MAAGNSFLETCEIAIHKARVVSLPYPNVPQLTTRVPSRWSCQVPQLQKPAAPTLNWLVGLSLGACCQLRRMSSVRTCCELQGVVAGAVREAVLGILVSEICLHRINQLLVCLVAGGYVACADFLKDGCLFHSDMCHYLN